MKRRSAWCVGMGLLLAAALVWGQAPPGRGPGPGGFGFGPPGFGPGFGPPGGAGSPIMLLGMPEVQKELNLRDEQTKSVTALLDDQRQQMEDGFRNFDPRQQEEATSEQREQAFADMRAKMEENNKKAEARLAEILDASQQKRLRQLRVQREGLLAFDRPAIAERLKLTDEQLDKLDELKQQNFPGFGPPRPNPEALAKAVALLSADQQATWKQLVGDEFKFPEGFGPGGRGPGGPGGPFGGAERKLLAEFDKDGDGLLNAAERQTARKSAASGQRPRGPGGRGPGGPGGGPGGPGGGPGGFGREPGKPGPRVSPQDVEPITGADLYDTSVLRTIFLEFENDDWEVELEDFHNTDVEVPATVIVDGQKYPQVGVHFRGASSYGMVPRGSKRSLNLSFDAIDSKQRLYGYKTLNLLNANGDASFLNSVLYSHIARQYIAAPKANLVKVVINGESWGVYVNVQQFDKIFTQENFKSKGTRWKVPGSPGGNAGLDYIGDNIADYNRRYEMKSNDDNTAWHALIKLCRTLKETPVEDLPAAIEPQLDVQSVLWFLALDNGLINSDGYWVRASDYSIFLDEKGVFHIIPHDMNETFHTAGGGPGMFGGPGGPGGRRGGGPGGRGPGGPDFPGGPGGPGRGPGPGPGGPGGRGPGGGGGGGFALDPLVGMNDSTKPLRSKLLAVPQYREQYLKNVRTLAEHWLDWQTMGPLVKQYSSLIEKEVAADTRKLSSFAAFEQAVATGPAAEAGGGGRRGPTSLWTFAQERRKYLLDYPAIKELPAASK